MVQKNQFPFELGGAPFCILDEKYSFQDILYL